MLATLTVTADREPDFGVDGGGASGDRGYVDCPQLERTPKKIKLTK
jgi:hypothetical protein